jgi:hypothetical protein
MRRFLLGLATSLCLGLPALAQDDLPESVFRDHAHMRGLLEQLMLERRIAEVMHVFGASDEMTQDELDQLQERVRAIFPEDFDQVALLKRDAMGDGWARELYVFWSGLNYIYASVIYHQRDSDLVAVHFKFNTDLDAMLADF